MTTVARPLSNAVRNQGYSDLRARFLADGMAAPMLTDRTAFVDRIVTNAWRSLLAPACSQPVAVIAVGGYGRRELFPYSDVDLLILTAGVPTAEEKEALAVVVGSLWDTGIRLSHSVHTAAECSRLHEQNIELNISLLDKRFLAGDRGLYEQFRDREARLLKGSAENLIQKLVHLTRSRHAKYQNTIHHLEPNIKEAPGGLRDLQLLGWLHKLRGDSSLASQWLSDLASSHEFLSALRCFLHYRAGRDDNILSFDAQEEIIAQVFVPFDDPAPWMRRYFLHARDVHRTAVRALEMMQGHHSSLWKSFRRWRSRLSNTEFSVLRERVYFKSPARIAYEPELVMRMFQFIGRHGVKPAIESENRIRKQLPALSRYFANPGPHWGTLREVLAMPRAALALRVMHDTGVLGAVFPEWKGVECLVVRDFYHRYTVDEHTLLSIEALEQLQDTSDTGRRRFAEILSEVEEPPLLRLALLFHDMGKAAGEEGHTGRSVRLAEQAMERIQIPAGEQSLVKFLVEKHLDLSVAMTHRDLDDPATARTLAKTVGTLERLKALTLLTYADISAVNPAAMTPWRLEQLWRVYLAAYHELTRNLDTDRVASLRLDSPEKAAFVTGFPRRYLRTHSENEISAHLELEEQSRLLGAAVSIRRCNGTYRATIIAKDRPHLFASLAGALAGCGMNIVKAEAFANQRDQVLDTFTFEDPSGTLELNPVEVEQLGLTLKRVALGKQRARSLLKHRRPRGQPWRHKAVTVHASFDNTVSGTATLIEIVAGDRPGVLYILSRAISAAGCNIEVVLVDTKASKAIDVFYVTYQGNKLSVSMAEELTRTLQDLLEQP